MKTNLINIKIAVVVGIVVFIVYPVYAVLVWNIKFVRFQNLLIWLTTIFVNTVVLYRPALRHFIIASILITKSRWSLPSWDAEYRLFDGGGIRPICCDDADFLGETGTLWHAISSRESDAIDADGWCAMAGSLKTRWWWRIVANCDVLGSPPPNMEAESPKLDI